VLAVTALGVTAADAIKKAYEAMGHVRFAGIQYRRDIGYKAVARRRG
jgi:phosphoribosylamine--glycine ligase